MSSASHCLLNFHLSLSLPPSLAPFLALSLSLSQNFLFPGSLSLPVCHTLPTVVVVDLSAAALRPTAVVRHFPSCFFPSRSCCCCCCPLSSSISNGDGRMVVAEATAFVVLLIVTNDNFYRSLVFMTTISRRPHRSISSPLGVGRAEGPVVVAEQWPLLREGFAETVSERRRRDSLLMENSVVCWFTQREA